MSQTAKQFAAALDLAAYDERAGKLVRRKAQFEEVEGMGKTQKVIRQSSRELNKTEERFRLTYLETWLRTGVIDRYGAHESITLRLGNGARFSPDFPTWKDGKLTFFEVKGAKVWDDAKDRLKFAPVAYPEFRFFVYQWKKGEWITQEVLP